MASPRSRNATGRRVAAEVHEKRLKALQMFARGIDYDTIAERLGYKGVSRRATVFNLIKAAMEAREAKGVDEARVLSAEALDLLADATWNRAVAEIEEVIPGEDGKDVTITKPVLIDVKAGALFVHIQARKAALLGLDAPLKMETTDPKSAEELNKVIDDKLKLLHKLETDAAKAKRKSK